MVQNLPAPQVYSHETHLQPPPVSYSFTRSGRRAVASDLSIVIWDQARVSYLGTLENAQWIEAITQGRNDSESQWEQTECKTQVFGKVSQTLEKNMGWKQYQFYVTFYHEGRQYAGFAVLRKRAEEYALLHLEWGIEEVQ